MAKAYKGTVSIHTDHGFQIEINGIVHLDIADPVKGIQSWKDNGWYFIEFSTDTASYNVEYAEFELWMKILDLYRTNVIKKR